MTRPSEVTRDRITKAAERLFAERGYDGTSVRAIVAKARVNQAAINYHFDGKDGLYREVLRAAFRAMTEDQLAHAEETKAMSREEALRAFIRRQLHPLMGRDEYSRYMRIFNWEAVRPTPVFRALVSEEAAPFMGLAADLVRRFLPAADPSDGDGGVDLADRPVQRVPAQPRAARAASDWACARRCGGRVADGANRELAGRRSRSAGLKGAAGPKIRGMPQKFLFLGLPAPKQLFEIQSLV